MRPAKAPGFAYAWLELVSHRVFIGRMLAITPQQRVRACTSSNLSFSVDFIIFVKHPYLIRLSVPQHVVLWGLCYLNLSLPVVTKMIFYSSIEYFFSLSAISM